MQTTPRLIDFDNLDNNNWHVVAELPFVVGEDEVRPDITSAGVCRGEKRTDRRHANRRFRQFVNLAS